MALKPLHFLSLFLLLILAFSFIDHAKGHIISGKNSSVFNFIKDLRGCHKGNKTEEIKRLRLYLKEFGYLTEAQTNSDYFDSALESAVKTYQQNFQLHPSGTLDSTTVSTMITPRCGVPDIINGTNYMQSHKKTSSNSSSTSSSFHIVSHYSFFSGSPKWSKRQLTFRFLSNFPTSAMPPVRNAFRKWSTATQYFSFSEVQSTQISDLSIAFYRDSHGDNYPFDGPGGTLAHAFSPSDGRFHYDADEMWSVGPVPNYIDLETVAVHEIGHLLGLGHSQDQAAIMFPSIEAGTTKNIQSDDIQGIKALYGY